MRHAPEGREADMQEGADVCMSEDDVETRDRDDSDDTSMQDETHESPTETQKAQLNLSMTW